MPRYRFRWEAVPQPLLRRLARDLELPGEAARALAETYGKRPRAEFVRDSWPVLRDVWLRKDTKMRRHVVAELRARGLGELGLPVGNRAEQLAYLLTCRNSPKLREVVLAAFHALGDVEPAERPASAPVPEAAALDGVDEALLDGAAFDAAVDAAWAGFATTLEAALRDLPSGPVTVALPRMRDGRGSGSCPEMVFRPGDAGRGLEAVLLMRYELAADGPLDRAGFATLADLGWKLDFAGRERLRGRLDARLGAARVAAASVVTMRDVFGVVHPSFLTTTNLFPGGCGGPEGGDDLGAGHSEGGHSEGYVADPADREVTYDIRSVAHLRELVDAALAPRLGGPPSHDEDDDVPIDMGPATCYVRVANDGAYVTVFTPLLWDVPGSALVLERLNQLNQGYRIVRFTWSSGVVTATMDVWCWPFVPALVRQAVDGMAAVVGNLHNIRLRLGAGRCGDD